MGVWIACNNHFSVTLFDVCWISTFKSHQLRKCLVIRSSCSCLCINWEKTSMITRWINRLKCDWIWTTILAIEIFYEVFLICKSLCCRWAAHILNCDIRRSIFSHISRCRTVTRIVNYFESHDHVLILTIVGCTKTSTGPHSYVKSYRPSRHGVATLPAITCSTIVEISNWVPAQCIIDLVHRRSKTRAVCIVVSVLYVVLKGPSVDVVTRHVHIEMHCLTRYCKFAIGSSVCGGVPKCICFCTACLCPCHFHASPKSFWVCTSCFCFMPINFDSCNFCLLIVNIFIVRWLRTIICRRVVSFIAQVSWSIIEPTRVHRCADRCWRAFDNLDIERVLNCWYILCWAI